MNSVRITGRGIYFPKLSHTNETLPALDAPPTPEQLARLGVHRRGWAGQGEGVAEMGAWAAERALASADTRAADIDLLILANWTQRRYIPELAPKIQQLLGAAQAFAFDVSGACTGFVSGVAIAHNFLQQPRYERALVVGSETVSQRAKPGSRATLVYGDAAAAWVLERGLQPGLQLIDYELQSDGSHHELMCVDEQGHVETHAPQMEINQLAAGSMARVSRKLLERNHLTLSDVTWVVPHSGTEGIQVALSKALEVPAEKLLSNFRSVGNVSSAAIPASLEHFIDAGQIKPGDLILSPAVGTGWYSSAMLYRI
ncbi:MAG TPA: ketoacyl-ACP synthase III [Polyangiaceae bacterium]|nr:ketoacyl-ACP synthase III [Polyangiaceae bacterium]